MDNSTLIYPEQLDVSNDTGITVKIDQLHFAILFSVSGAIMILGNGLVILALFTTPALQTTTNMFILNLAFTDLLVGLDMPVFVTRYFRPDLTDSFLACIVLRTGPFMTLIMTSVLLCMGISADRYFAVHKPFLYATVVTPTRVRFLLVVIWLYAISVFYLPMVLSYHNWRPGSNCHVAFVFPTPIYLAYALHIMFALSFNICAYGLLFITAARHQRRITAQGADSGDEFKRNLKAAKTVGLVVGMFTVCCMPYGIVIVCTITFDRYMENPTLYSVSRLAGMFLISNSAINPFIYATKMSAFRKAFRRLLGCPANAVDRAKDSTTATTTA